MNETDFTKYIVEISQQLGAISSKLDSVCNSLLAHEGRISRLEETIAKMNGQSGQSGQSGQKGNKNDDDFKTDLLKLLAKSLVIGLTIIASLTGASGLVKQIWTTEKPNQCEVQSR